MLVHVHMCACVYVHLFELSEYVCFRICVIIYACVCMPVCVLLDV